MEEFQTSERRVCGLMKIPRMTYRYRSLRDDSALHERLLALAREKPRFGYRRLWVLLGTGNPGEIQGQPARFS
jgi:putative transposase